MAVTRTDETGDETLTAYYNGACPVCRPEIEHYARIAARNGRPQRLVDISRDRTALAEYGVDEVDVLRRLHVLDGDGRLHRGVDAFIAIWRTLPRYRWLARVMGAPVVRPIAGVVYDRMVAPLIFAWNVRSGRVRL